MSSKTFLYKAIADNGELLNVGITKQTNIRMEAHAKKSEWFPLAANIEYVEFQDRDAALLAESEAIYTFRPRFNIRGNPNFRMPAGEAKQKIFRLSVDLIADLRRAAYERSIASGKRVTETEIIESALRFYLPIAI